MRKEEFDATEEVYGRGSAYEKAVKEAEKEAEAKVRRESAERRKRFLLQFVWGMLALYAILVSLFIGGTWAVSGIIRASALGEAQQERARTDALRALLIEHKIEPDPYWRDSVRSLKARGGSSGAGQ